ncbi:Na(+)-translocating NADH-quinone reductase subunit A, partial [Escherichia coli]|nr:Na(+)-translocating NADH-quinone reductase subunit A [Escherichia coli]
ETPGAIFVMAIDTRPDAPDPALALAGREEDLDRGLAALSQLTAGPVFLCEPKERPVPGPVPTALKRLRVGGPHPQGLAGLLIHRHIPAAIDAPVWEIHAEDVADLGALLATGLLRPTRLVSVSGDGLREARLVRCQAGADLRDLSRPVMRPGPREISSGSYLDGRPARWLGGLDRQVTVQGRHDPAPRRHWFGSALARASRQMPIIPTAALDQSFGGRLPAMALIRALALGDAESFARLGGLSLLEDDVALADYATAARPRLATQLRALLDRLAIEEGTR